VTLSSPDQPAQMGAQQHNERVVRNATHQHETAASRPPTSKSSQGVPPARPSLDTALSQGPHWEVHGDNTRRCREPISPYSTTRPPPETQEYIPVDWDAISNYGPRQMPTPTIAIQDDPDLAEYYNSEDDDDLANAGLRSTGM
jgi:hypothetical protein